MSISMTFTEGVHLARALKKSAEDNCRMLDDYMDTMTLPEGTDKVKRETVKIWVHHYINGVCSFESLLNMTNALGLDGLFNEPQKALECNKDGNIRVYQGEEKKRPE